MPAMMSRNKTRLLELIRSRAYRRGAKDEFTLASGKKSDTYIDGKMVQLHPESAYLLGECLYELLENEDFDAIGGLAIGAVPLVSAFVISCHHHGRPVEGFFVREKQKEHGTEKKIDGCFKKGCKAVILDDVVTAGGSVLKAVEAAQTAGAEIVMVVAVVDREEGGSDKIRENHRFQALFTKRDLAGEA
jgi:orotate phosphoribosyltransferase